MDTFECEICGEWIDVPSDHWLTVACQCGKEYRFDVDDCYGMDTSRKIMVGEYEYAF